MSIDTKTLNSPSLNNENLQSKMQLDTREQLESLRKSKENQLSESRLEELALLSSVEKGHYESLKEKGREIMAENIEDYFSVIGKKFDKNDGVANSIAFKVLENIIEAVAQFYSAKKMPLGQKESEFISRLDPKSLKAEYEKVQEYYAGLRIVNQKASIIMYKGAIIGKKKEHDEGTDITTCYNDIQDMRAKEDKEKGGQPTILASRKYDVKETPAVASNAPASAKSEKYAEVSSVYDKFLANAKSDGDKEILKGLKDKISVNETTGELSLVEAVKFGEDGELVLSPDKKGVILRGYGYEYRLPKLDAKSIEFSLNKISSLNFMENTGLTAFTPIEMKDISLNLNKYFDITNGIPINLDKPEGLTQAEKIELLAIFSKLKVIGSYDPHNLSKKIITKNLFISNLKNNTNFYKGQGQLNMMAFDQNIKHLVSKKDPQNQSA